MGQKDLAQSDYLDDKTRFADMCNGILFRGKAIIKPGELQEAGEEIVYQEDKGRRKIIPDKVRLWNGIYLAIISVENQTKVDYRMVFRMMKEEAVSYERQWTERERGYRKAGILGKKSRLCWVGKDEKFIPVIPIVIYYGTEKKWDGATCLYDMLNMDEAIAPYIVNYKLNLFDYHNYKDFSMFKTENRELFEVLSCAKMEKRMDELIHRNAKRYKELPYDAAKLICDIAGIKVSLIKDVEEDGREVVDMCKAWDDHRNEGVKVGRKEGRKAGIEEARKDSIQKLIKNLSITVEEAMDILEIPMKERKAYMK